ncbi:MAG: methyltransferase domain-containing protein [Deltaproteobacteria bacterium]|nr:methyltransferase domain-containing protein [Deltaproteobacteria bacterium]
MGNHREIYRIDRLPVFQNRMFESEAEARNAVTGDLVLVQDRRTGLVFNKAFQPELVQYDACYQNEQAVSPVFRAHLDQAAAIITKCFGRNSLIEVGCGKGYFLEMLQGMGIEITGFDPAYEGSNPRVIKRYFEPGIGIRADGIILRHVLEHVMNPVLFLQKIKDANAGNGRIYIEVPCLDWICERRAWFDIFYEHVNYFRLSDFHRMFAHVIEAGHIFGGQYIYVVAELSSLRTPQRDRSDDFCLPDGFLNSVNRYAASFNSPGRGSRNTDFFQSAVWGGASKGVLFSLLLERAGARVDIIIDINPAKQSRYLPATGLKVLSPEDAMKRLSPGAKIFVMNSNYLSEIKEMSCNSFDYIGIDHDQF